MKKFRLVIIESPFNGTKKENPGEFEYYLNYSRDLEVLASKAREIEGVVSGDITDIPQY